MLFESRLTNRSFLLPSHFFLDLPTTGYSLKEVVPKWYEEWRFQITFKILSARNDTGAVLLVTPKDPTTLSNQFVVLVTIRGSVLTIDIGYYSVDFSMEIGKTNKIQCRHRKYTAKTSLMVFINGGRVLNQKVSPTYSVLNDVEVHYGSPDYPAADVEIYRFVHTG